MAHRAYLVFALMTLCLSTCLSITSIKRQGIDNDGVKVPSRDLLPPPALSASFPTLRPNPGNSVQQSPQINLIPPFRPPGSKVNSHPSPASPSNTKSESTLLPPIEIPPAKPLTDAEIAELSFVESSFVPTTGQGVGGTESRKNVKLTVEEDEVLVPVVSPVQIIQSNVKIGNSKNTTLPTRHAGSNVKFPDSLPIPNQLCPICECTPEVDYICGSNGVIYLNSCSFDCATFCEAGLTKVSLEFCSLPNHL